MTTTAAPTTAAPTAAQLDSPFGRRASRSEAAARQRRAVAFGLLISAQMVVMLDTSIVNVALPSIQDDLGVSSTALTWVVNAYVLSFGGLLLLSGRAADLFGRRRMFIGGSAVFTAGTLLAAAAANESMLVAGRVIQGAGAAALSPAAMSLLLLTFPGPARAKAMSAWGAASAIGGATGVLFGGLLTGTFGWSAVFLVTVPVSLTAIILARRVLDEGATGTRHRFDWAGAATITGAVIALVHGALGAVDGSWHSISVLGSLAAAAGLATAFIRIERAAPEPLVPLELFGARSLSTGVALAVFGGAARASTFVLIALCLQQAMHLAPRQAGLAMVPTSLTGFAVSLAVLPRALKSFGPRRTLVAGLVILAAGHLWLAYGPHGAGYMTAVLPGLLLVAVGVAFSFTPTTMVVAAAVPDTHTGLASGLAGSATQVGAALGTAIFTAIGISVAGSGAAALGTAGYDGFTAAFTAAAIVSLATAVLGSTLPRTRH